MMFQKGDIVELMTSYHWPTGEFFQAGSKYEIKDEVWPDAWILKGNGHDHLHIFDSDLHAKFKKIQKPQPLPVPKSLEKWYHQVKIPHG